MPSKTLVAIALFFSLYLSTSSSAGGDAAPKPAAESASAAIVAGMEVSLEYTLSDEAGAQIETNKGRSPLVFTQGKGQIIPGLEKALPGLKKGEEKDVKVPPEEAYGPVRKEAFHEVPKDKVPAEGLSVGKVLYASTGQNAPPTPVRVAEVKEKTVLLDFNHPMAGKTLLFHVKVLDVKEADKSPAAEDPHAQHGH